MRRLYCATSGPWPFPVELACARNEVFVFCCLLTKLARPFSVRERNQKHLRSRDVIESLLCLARAQEERESGLNVGKSESREEIFFRSICWPVSPTTNISYGLLVCSWNSEMGVCLLYIFHFLIHKRGKYFCARYVCAFRLLLHIR